MMMMMIIIIITIIAIVRLLKEQNVLLINIQMSNKIVFRLSLKYIEW